LESATIEENLPTSAEESIVKFSQELSSKYDERPVVVNVRLVPPVCGPVVGDSVQTEPSPLSELSILPSRMGLCDTIGESITLSIIATNSPTTSGALTNFCIKHPTQCKN
jgi:hypothetical protein